MTQREFIALYCQVKPSILKSRRLKFADDAEDIVQQTVLELCKNRGYVDCPPTADGMKKFLFSAIALRRLRARSIEHTARAIRYEASDIDNLDESEHPTVDPYPAIELKVAVEKALAQLPEDTAVAVRLVHMEGHTIEEAAERLGVPMRTLQKRLQRAAPQLRELLADYK